MRYFTGVGSRETPNQALAALQRVSARLAAEGYVLRSGGAPGADTAFEQGAAGQALIYLPWAGFNDHPSPYCVVSKAAMEIAERVHPAWHLLSEAAKKLHGRNVYQVLGLELNRPSEFLVCWTPGGKVRGGTATAIRIAQIHGVPVYNLAAWSEKALMRKLGLDGPLIRA